MPLSLRIHPSWGLWILVVLLLGVLLATMAYSDSLYQPRKQPAPLSPAERQETSHKRLLALRLARQAAELPALASPNAGRLIPADISGPAFEAPLPALHGELAAGFAWADAAGQEEHPALDPYHGIALLVPPAEHYGGLRPWPFSHNSFLESFARMLDKAWGGKGGSSISRWDDTMYSSDVHVKAEFIRPHPSGEKNVVQGVGVVLVGDAPVFLMARRASDGDPRADMALVEEELTRLTQAMAATPPLLLLQLQDQAARSLVHPLVWLPALAAGWLYALESGFAALAGVWIGAAATLLSVLIGFFFGPVFPGNPLMLASAVNMLAGALYAVLGARLRRRFRPAGLNEALTAQEHTLMEEFRTKLERVGRSSGLSRYENKIWRLAADRKERICWHRLQALMFFIAALVTAGQFQEYRDMTDGGQTGRITERLSAPGDPENFPPAPDGPSD